MRSAMRIALMMWACLASTWALAQEQDHDLAKQSQNPVASLISLPLQNNLDFGLGDEDAIKNTLNIQPVIPVGIGKVNLINRAILPVVYQGEQEPGTGSVSGLGDLSYTAFFSPAEAGKVIWGAGPAFLLPTATDDRLGTGKFSLGPGVVVLTMPGKWVVGALVQNVWSVAGDADRADVNSFVLQGILNYNLEKGWYLTSIPIITANWEAESGQKWTVPVGGGFGRIFRMGSQPVDIQTQAFWYATTPDGGPSWEWRFQFKFLFPM